ncbi:hypothetical protein NLG97_g1522 [Lecanicillium saksenae]|uniref:Uncharacterized protein n=1 Tax=Lecanicillium saksenae TaxID=468837 RepID=A0ACC1R451_9HYPO|nr:hypothetical protein NLG97_g1522 [Lecanicillium saksenae]
MSLSEENLRILNANDDRTPSPELSPEAALSGTMRLCLAMATRLQRADGGNGLRRLGLRFSNGILMTATGEQISRKKEKWDEIYQKLQDQYNPLHAALFPKTQARRLAPPRPDQRRIDEDHRILTKKLGAWLAASANTQSTTGAPCHKKRVAARIGQRRSRRLAGQPPELREGLVAAAPFPAWLILALFGEHLTEHYTRLLRKCCSSLFMEFDDNARFRCFEPPQLLADPFHDKVGIPCVESDGTPAPELQVASFLRVSLDQRPKCLMSGWVFGSDPVACDILIGAYEQGISRKQFAIIPQEDVGRVIILNLSRHGTHILERDGDITTLTPVKSQCGLSEGQHATFLLGAVELDIITAAERGDLYRMNWSRMYEEQQQAGITMNSLTLEVGAPSTCVGEYIPQHVLANHTDYTTFIATERGGRTKVLLKRYRLDKWRNAEKEASLLGRIQHEHIMAFREYIPSPSVQLIFSNVPGETLEAEHNFDPILFREFKFIIPQLLQALAYLHGLEIYHGQISPRNIVVGRRRPRPHVMLHDFNMDAACKSRVDCIDKDMDEFLDLCILFLSLGRSEDRFFFNNNAMDILRAVVFRRRGGPPPNEANSLLEDADLLTALSTPSERDDHALRCEWTSVRAGDDVSSLPDTELPFDYKEDIEIDVFEQGLGKVLIRRDGPDYELNLSQLIRSSRMSRWRGQQLRKRVSDDCRKEGKGNRVVYWMPLCIAVGLTRDLGFNELFRKLHDLAVERHIYFNLAGGDVA